MASACNNDGGVESYESHIFRFSRRDSDSSNESLRRSSGFIRRFPCKEDIMEAPTFDRILLNPDTGVSGFIKLPQLPDLRTLSGLGFIPGIRSSEEESSGENQSDEEDKISKVKEVEEFAKTLQKQIIELYEDENIPTEFQSHKIRGTITKFAKFAINDYSPDSYHYIWCILLDTKSIFKQVGDEENKDMVLNVMKMLRSKFLIEGIPSGGAGGWDLYEHTPI